MKYSEAMPAVSRRDFLITSASATASLAIWPRASAGNSRYADPPIVGAGEHTYKVLHDWLTPPKNLLWGDTHGLCQDSQGRIYVAHTVHGSSELSDAVLVFDPDGKFMSSWGAEFRGGAHGLDVRIEDGDEFLYHCDINRRLIIKTSLDGEVVWQLGFPVESEKYENASRFCPTNVAFAPNGDLYVGDGYGSSFIHQYNIKGEYIRTIGSPGAEPGQLNCPHGLWVDERGAEPQLLVADRGNRRLHYFSLTGQALGVVTEGIRMPCHFKTRGDLLLIPDLESVIMLLDGENKVVAMLGDGHPSSLRGAARDQFIPGQFVHPHDAIFLENGDILVAEWVPIGRITRLARA